MRYFLFFILIFFNLNSERNKYLLSFNDRPQKNRLVQIIQDTLMFTPGGPALKSNIHYIDNKHHLNICDNRLQIVETKTGFISQEFKRSNSQNRAKSEETFSQRLPNNSVLTNADFSDGWITYAYSQIYEDNPGPITSFSTKWIVPQPPENKSDQLIYIFNGIQTIENGIAYILQPVLQWGKSPAGGGNYWSVCNWYVTSNQFFFDSLIQVHPGTSLQGLIRLTSKTDSLFNYTS